MQFSFRQQQSGSATVTNTEQQPSDCATKNAASIIANATKMPFSMLSQTVQKAISIDDRDHSANSSVPIAISAPADESAPTVNIECGNKIETKTINNNNESDCKKSIGSDSNLVVAIDSTKVQSEESVSSTEKCVPSISFSGTPTINVVCAPAVEDDDDDDNVSGQLCYGSKTVDERASEIDTDDDKSVVTKSPIVCEPPSTPMETTSSMQLLLDVKKCDDGSMISVEDLSPSMDEYQECCGQSTDYQYDAITGEVLAPGCVPPAPTPAPLIAPLAEVEFYPADEDTPLAGTDESTGEPAVAISSSSDSTAKPQSRTKKKKPRLTTEKSESKSDATTKSNEEINRNAVCPWEDDE